MPSDARENIFPGIPLAIGLKYSSNANPAMATAVTTTQDPEAPHFGQAAGPCAMVLFGASGDLTKRKLVPALFNLVKASLLPKNFAILGVAVDQLAEEQFRSQVTSFLPAEDRGTEAWNWFQQRLYYQAGDFADPATYSTVTARLGQIDQQHNTEGNYLFYLATSPKFFASIVEKLGGVGLPSPENGHRPRGPTAKTLARDPAS